MNQFMGTLVGYVWGTHTFILLVGCGLFFTLYLGAVQFRAFWHGIQVVMGKFDKHSDPGEITHFKALCSALSATVGLGNIAGVAVAISLGGPGATFWMIVTGLVGMVTKFVECTLAIKYRKVDDAGVVHGGPMYYITLGLGDWAKFLSVIYAVCVIFGSFGAVSLFQSNQVASIMHSSFGISQLLTGAVLCFLTAIVIIGGIKRIATVASKIVPAMAILYVGGALLVLALNFEQIPLMISLILDGACSGTAATGAFAGVVVRDVLMRGVQRACFSNEAGLGTAAIAHSAAKTKEAVREGVVAMLGPFIDTVVICSMTAFVIISSGLWSEDYANLGGVNLTADAFNKVIPGFGAYFIPVAVFLFAYSTLISWYYYGERAMEYLFPSTFVMGYKFLYVILIVVGSVWTLKPILDFSDAVIGIMIIPNIIALLLMSPRVKAWTTDYFSRLKAGKFD
ncbi:MAG: sodium:alanine symporter family protein [Deltaproteobacteria bacterium]|nr:sodium:alanine symporter family protein [Deltaproteobacteria bacterium]